MSLKALYFLHNTPVLPFYIDIVLTLSIIISVIVSIANFIIDNDNDAKCFNYESTFLNPLAFYNITMLMYEYDSAFDDIKIPKSTSPF